MKWVLFGMILVLGLLITQNVNAYYYSYYPFYSYQYYRYYGYYGPYRWGYANPYLIDRPLRTIERNPMTDFSLANTNMLYRYTSNRYYTPFY